ncbi:aminotransferase class V-fold PLP-dependent enzyme [Nonlabens tegetincola]|uniref:aminotransferase class V-fold PLP-dependent enzyme n=1 Tax=Nonlabens tegetincola TaxID=323273 RepID=UPI000CF493B3|nr:aminotransferase class V-fold PLP-dependent enzyme [Nonlabens tegetincola]
MDSSLIKNLRAAYPILNRYTYLNVANHGLLSQAVINERIHILHQLRDEGSKFTNLSSNLIDTCRKRLSQFLDSHIDYTAFVPNFSQAFIHVLHTLDKESKFLLIENDYPSLNDAVRQRGFITQYVTIDNEIEQKILEAFREEAPDFFCFSMVQYISGIQLNNEFIKQLKHEFPDTVFIADLTQYVGCEEFRFRESGIDIIIASCYKWLHAGDGIGFISIQPDSYSKVSSHLNQLINTRQDNRSLMIQQFEPGHVDLLAISSLNLALKEVEKIGIQNIDLRHKTLSKNVFQEFKQRKLLDPSVMHRESHSGIFNINGDEHLYQKLLDSNIITSLRGPGIRVSFCYLNTLEELHHLLHVLVK